MNHIFMFSIHIVNIVKMNIFIYSYCGYCEYSFQYSDCEHTYCEYIQWIFMYCEYCKDEYIHIVNIANIHIVHILNIYSY